MLTSDQLQGCGAGAGVRLPRPHPARRATRHRDTLLLRNYLHRHQVIRKVWNLFK